MRSPASPSLFMLLRRSPSPWHRPSQCLRQIQSNRSYSNFPLNSLVKVRSIPAPHTGLITILSLASPNNKNAISRQLLQELSVNISDVFNQWDNFTGRKGASNMLKRHGVTSAEGASTKTGVGELSDRQGYGHVSGYVAGGALTPRHVHDSTRVLILSSDVENVFCAGADLKERAGMNYEQTERFLFGLRRALGRLATLPIPSVSAISGFALGGGLELALATTFRVLSTTATVGLPETRLGIIPGAGGPMRLSELIGDRKAADLILTGRRIDGREAFRLGLCERLVEENEGRVEKPSPSEQRMDSTLETAIKMAKDICEGAPVATGAALRLVGRGLSSKDGRAEWEELMYQRTLKTEDRDEALLAFREKRKPTFKGR